MSIPASTQSASVAQAPVVNSEGQLLMCDRVKDPAALKGIYSALWDADWLSSRNRALYQAAIDGAAPYSDTNDKMKGRFGRSNVNWGTGDQSQFEVELPFFAILDALDIFGSVSTTFGTEQEQSDWNPKLSEEFTRMIRKWPEFEPAWKQNVHLFTMDGVSFCLFEDDIDWRWRPDGLQSVKFYRQTKANVEALDIIAVKREMLPHELMAKIRNKEAAEAVGWNCEEVEKVVKKATPKELRADDPQQWESMWKNNDIYSSLTSQTCTVIQAWVKELDGTVTHLYADYNCADGAKWMYCSKGKYHSMSNAVTSFIIGVGTNGDFHSIRGNGQKIFASTTALEKLMNKAVDMSVHASTPIISTNSEDDLSEGSIRPMGPYALITSGIQFQEIKVPEFQNSLGPAISMLQGVYQSRTSGMAQNSANAMSKTEKTKYQVQLESDVSNRLSGGAFSLFFAAWERHLKEVLRRVIREDYQQSDPGGKEVWEMRRRLLKRGVPLEAIYAVDVDDFEVNQGIGKGSPSERRSVADALKERVYNSADPEGKAEIDRMIVAAYTNAKTAKRIIPDTPGLRPPIDANIAVMENSILALGQPAVIMPNQNHLVHAQIHIGKVDELSTMFNEGQLPFEEFINQAGMVWAHGQEHLPYLDPTTPDAAQLREAYQQYGEVITNGQKHLAKEEQRAMAEQEGGEAMSGAELSTYGKVVDAQARTADLEFDATKKAMELSAKDAEHKQRLAQNDVAFAQKLRQTALANATKPRKPDKP